MNIRLVGAILAGALIVGGYVLYGRYGPPSIIDDTAAMDAQLQAEDTAVLRTVKTRFPDEYQGFLADMVEAMSETASGQAIARRAQVFVAELRKTHGPALLRATDAEVRPILTLSRDLHRRIREAEGREGCNAFAIGGPPTLANRISPYLEDIDRQGALLLDAIAVARSRDAEAASAPAAAEDWEAAIDRMVATGGSEADRQALVNLDPSSDLCRALGRLLDTMLAMEGERGTRLRVTYVRDLAIN